MIKFILGVVLLVSGSIYSMGSKPIPLPNQSYEVKGVRYIPYIGYTREEKEVLVIAEKLSNDLIQGECFRNFMVSRPLIDTENRIPYEVVEHLRTTNLMVPVVMYSNYFSNVVGYRQPPSPTIYTNRKYHAGSTACSRASNLTHEWSHVVGYGHSFDANSRRPFSVPYSINEAFRVCCTCTNIRECSIK